MPAPPSSWQPLVAAAYLAGLVAVLGWRARQARRLRGLLRHASPVVDPALLEAAGRWRARYRLRRQVALLVTDEDVMPFTSGIREPRIVLPARLLVQASHAELECILAHELAHVRRGDALRLLAQGVVQVLHWFHPAAWWASARIDDQREQLCDRLVLAHEDLDPERYAKSLTAVLRLGLLPPAHASLSLSPKRRIRMRLLSILEARRPEGRVVRYVTVAAAATAGALLLPMAPAGAGEGDARQPESNETIALAPAIQLECKWEATETSHGMFRSTNCDGCWSYLELHDVTSLGRVLGFELTPTLLPREGGALVRIHIKVFEGEGEERRLVSEPLVVTRLGEAATVESCSEGLPDGVLLQEARALGLTVTRAEVDRAVRRIMDENRIAGEADLESRLSGEGRSLATLRAEIEERSLIEKVRRQEIASRGSTEEQAQRSCLRLSIVPTLPEQPGGSSP